MPERETLPTAEFLGDGISAELSAAVHAVAAALLVAVEFHPVDLSLPTRQKDAKACHAAAQAAIRAHGLAMKFPTTTAQESPIKVLRDECNFTVIHRPVANIPGVATRHDGEVDLHIIRITVGGTYEDAGRRIGTEAAVSIRVIERRPSREAALLAFAMLLTHCGFRGLGSMLDSAIRDTIASGKRTRDLGGELSRHPTGCAPAARSTTTRAGSG